MQSLWNFLLNILENDNSNLQTKFGVQITGLHQHPTSRLWKLTLSPGEVVCSIFFIFFARMRWKDEPEQI